MFPVGIEYALDIHDDAWIVDYDPAQMYHVIKSVLINAVEAMPTGGRIKIRVDNVPLYDEGGDVSPPLKEGRYVRIVIKDGGSGIPKEHLSRVFEPYFSTKKMGSQKGTGLGLARRTVSCGSTRDVSAWNPTFEGDRCFHLPARRAEIRRLRRFAHIQGMTLRKQRISETTFIRPRIQIHGI